MLCPISSTTLFSIRRLFSILRCLILTRFWAAALITSISASTKSKVRVGRWSYSIWDISILKSSNYDFYWRYSVFCLIFSGLEGLSQIFQQPFWWWASMCLWEGDQEINHYPHFHIFTRRFRLFFSSFLVFGVHWSLPSLCLPSLPHSWSSRLLPSSVRIDYWQHDYQF